MKLNLPSTLTKQKMSTLFLLVFLQVNGVKSGRDFNNCLARTISSPYNLLNEFPFFTNSAINNGEVLKLCCTSSQCVSQTKCTGDNFGCSKIAQTIACSDSGSSGGGCGGIVGDTPVTSNTTLGNFCPNDINTIANYISTVSPTNANNGYASLACPADSPCAGLICDWDNGGWTCFSYGPIGCNLDGNGNYACSHRCNLQWTVSNSDLVISSNSVSVSAASTISPSNSPTSSSSNNFLSSNSPSNPHLVEKIAIPIGTTIGVGSGGGLVYYLIRRRSKKVLFRKENNKSVELMAYDLATRAETSTSTNIQSEEEQSAHEIYLAQNQAEIRNQYQTQIIQLPPYRE